MPYIQRYDHWVGHSVTDAATLPSAVGKLNQYRYDTDKKRLFYSDNTQWVPIAFPPDEIPEHTRMKNGKSDFMFTTLKADGIMSDIQSLGTFNGKALDANGTMQSWSTGTPVVANAGVGILPTIGSEFQGFTRTNWNPYYRIRTILPARISNDLCFYSGFIKNSTGPLLGEDPILQTEGGIVLGFNSIDDNWSVWHGDGTNVVTKTPLSSIPVPTAITQYRIEMNFNSFDNITVTIRNASDVVLQSVTITTNLLATARTINWVHCIQNPSLSNKTIYCIRAEMRTLI